MEMKTSSLVVLAIVLAIIAFLLVQVSKIGERHRIAAINSFADCVAAGNPVMESYPEQCRSADGRLFVNPEQSVRQLPQSGEQGAGDASGTMPAYQASDGCVIGGCSGEVCSDAADGPVVSNCIFKPEYACYGGARCERQANGSCGWTQTPELLQCLANPPASSGGLEAY